MQNGWNMSQFFKVLSLNKSCKLAKFRNDWDKGLAENSSKAGSPEASKSRCSHLDYF